MKRFLSTLHKLQLQLLMMGALLGCDNALQDVVPAAFEEFVLYPDEVYDYNAPDQTSLLRLDPLFNDSIKTTVRVTFGQPSHGQFVIEPDGYTYYTPEPGYLGEDTFTYTACSDKTCKTETIRVILEAPADPETCTMSIMGEWVETTKNSFVDIRIFANDEICGFLNASYFFPERGQWEDISYSGPHLKNKLFRYYPPKDYVGQDTFVYQVTNNETGETQEGVVTITIK